MIIIKFKNCLTSLQNRVEDLFNMIGQKVQNELSALLFVQHKLAKTYLKLSTYDIMTLCFWTEFCASINNVL